MKQLNFNIQKTHDNCTQFISSDITITVTEYSYDNGHHQIVVPEAARALFNCGEEKYIIENTEGYTTIEDWYEKELLPKFQMLILLTTMSSN